MSIFTGKRVLVFGDSLAGGLGPRLNQIIQADGGQPLPFVSRVGWSTNRFVQAQDWDMNGVDLAVIILGTNDDPQSVDSYNSILNAFVQRVRSYNVSEIVWIGPPTVVRDDIADRVAQVAAWQGDFLPGLGVNWVDSRNLARSDAGDKVHFTGAGYTAWTNAVVAQLGSGVMGTIFTPKNLLTVGFLGLLAWLLLPSSKPEAPAAAAPPTP